MVLKKKYLFLLTLCFLISPKGFAARKPKKVLRQPSYVEPKTGIVQMQTGDFEQNLGSDLYFKGFSKPLSTNLSNIDYIGKLETPSSKAYHVFQGQVCFEDMLRCNRNPNIFLINPWTKHIEIFVMPGKIYNKKNNDLLHASRAFVGKCLYQDPAHFIVFQSERIDRKPQLQRSIFIVEPNPDGDGVTERLVDEHRILPRRLPPLKKVLDSVKSGYCMELPSLQRGVLEAQETVREMIVKGGSPKNF